MITKSTGFSDSPPNDKKFRTNGLQIETKIDKSIKMGKKSDFEVKKKTMGEERGKR
jgi:hypothetical protein